MQKFASCASHNSLGLYDVGRINEGRHVLRREEVVPGLDVRGAIYRMPRRQVSKKYNECTLPTCMLPAQFVLVHVRHLCFGARLEQRL